jgi:AraC family transcriptional regulator
MLPVDISLLPATSALALVARSSDNPPEFVLADRPMARFMTARWHRSQVRLDEPRRLDHHLLSYCERGGAMCTLVVDEARVHGRQHTGSLTFLPAGRAVSWLLEIPAEVVHTHLYIADEVVREVLRAGPDDDAEPYSLMALLNVHDPWFDGFFKLMAAECEACRSRGQLQDFDLFDRVGSLLVRRLLELQGGARPCRTGVAPLRAFVLHEIAAHVEANLAECIKLERLANMASMSVDHFVRAFAQATGSTPYRWILDRRLDAACTRLRQGNDRIEAISRECGFSGASHLCTAFRRRYGVTPIAFRCGGTRKPMGAAAEPLNR